MPTAATRKSPAAHARDTPVGTVALGGDGRKWVVVQVANSKRWAPLPEPVTGKAVFSQHNGGKPYLVRYTKDTVSVFKDGTIGWDEIPDEVYEDDKALAKYYTSPVLKPTKFVKAFVGKDPADRSEDGNSMLFDLGGLRYLYVGETVYTFKAASPVVKYVSPVGNSAVPYPYAVTKDASYLMIEHVFVPHADKATRDQDPYQVYYRAGIKESVQMSNKRMKEYAAAHPMAVRVVHGRGGQ